jgi:hypothetical protein
MLLPDLLAIDAERAAVVDAQVEKGHEMTRILREVDPYLECVFIGRGSDVELPGVLPGHWHIMRHNPETADTYIPITAPDGSYAEPGSWCLDLLRERDLQNPEAYALYQDAEKKRKIDLIKRREEDKAARIEEMAMRYKALTSPGIAFGTQNWRNSARGRRG